MDILSRFGEVRRALSRHVGSRLPQGIGLTQALMIRKLGIDRECSVAELARATMSDPAAAGKAVDALIRRGLLEQREHPTDRRRWVITLTDAGRRTVKQVERFYASIADCLVSPLSAAERETFYRLLTRIANGIQEEAKAVSNEGRA